MFGLEKGGEILIFMSRYFDKTMPILILHFLCFGTLKITGHYFLLRISQMIYSKQKKIDVLFISAFSQHFSHSIFSPFIYQGWRTNGVWIFFLYISM